MGQQEYHEFQLRGDATSGSWESLYIPAEAEGQETASGYAETDPEVLVNTKLTTTQYCIRIAKEKWEK